MKIEMPPELVGDSSTIYAVFLQYANTYGDSKDRATQLVRLLPAAIKEAPVWRDKVTGLWRYQYGLPLDRMPNGIIISGTVVHLPVQDLYLAISIAEQRLLPTQLLRYLERLIDKAKHVDVLFEMRPLKKIRSGFTARYEVAGLGIGNTTCDWQIRRGFLNIVLDVKNRTKSLVGHMEHFVAAIQSRASTTVPPSPDPADLFRNVEEKLKESFFLRQLQGVWIYTDIVEDERRLTEYFQAKVNREKVHFAILSDWNDDAFILARNKFINIVVKRVFLLTESKRFVTSDYSEPIRKTT